MENKIISIDTLQKLLNPREMQNVLGGSGGEITKECDADMSSGCDNDTPCTKRNGDTGTCKYEKNSVGIWQCRCS